MGEWRDPLWVVRFRFAALLFFSMGILPSNARADIHHSVFGLNPRMAYDVYVGDLAVMVGVYPSPAGDLTFIASVADPVRVVPNGVPHLAGMPSSPARGLGVSPPMPNPTGGSFEIRIDADRAGEVRISLIDAAAGRSRYVKHFMIPLGESQIRLAIPARLASGFYLVCVESGSSAVVRKVLLLRGGGGTPKG